MHLPSYAVSLKCLLLHSAFKCYDCCSSAQEIPLRGNVRHADAVTARDPDDPDFELTNLGEAFFSIFPNARYVCV